MASISMRDMLAAGVHFGHRTRFWNPKMAPYIFGSRDKVHIINLEITLPLYQEAVNYVGQLAANKSKILFVGTKRAAQSIIKEQATRCDMPFIDHRWLGGMLTNYKTVRQSVKRLKELEELRDSGAFNTMIKKEALQLSRQLEKLERGIGGIKDMGSLPDALFVIDVGYEKIAIQEANRLKIPVIGIVDTNNDPDNINYVIPGNDDSMGAIALYTMGIADAIIEAKMNAVEQLEAELAENRDKKVAAESPVAEAASSLQSDGADPQDVVKQPIDETKVLKKDTLAESTGQDTSSSTDDK